MRSRGAGFQPANSIREEGIGRQDACPTSVHRTRPAMGTLFEVLLHGDDEEHLTAVAEAVLDKVVSVERLLSRFDPRSEVSRINRLAASEAVLVDREVADLLQVCFDAGEWTGGAFDITATSMMSNGSLGLPNVRFDSHRRTITFADPRMRLDLGGIGKGYALDRAAALLDEHGIEHALLHGGTSSVLARGTNIDDRPWRIALPEVLCEDRFVMLENAALSCSAVNEQQDIIDPITGQPLLEPSAVAVVAPSATHTEILSTALVCLGPDRAAATIPTEKLSGCRIVWLATEPSAVPV
jgi:FAD:protein FMN transferase